MFQNSLEKQIPKLSLRVKFEQVIIEKGKEPSCFKIKLRFEMMSFVFDLNYPRQNFSKLGKSLRVKFEKVIMEKEKEPSCFKIRKINKTATLVVA